jgi:hypothetical protein
MGKEKKPDIYFDMDDEMMPMTTLPGLKACGSMRPDSEARNDPPLDRWHLYPWNTIGSFSTLGIFHDCR